MTMPEVERDAWRDRTCDSSTLNSAGCATHADAVRAPGAPADCFRHRFFDEDSRSIANVHGLASVRSADRERVVGSSSAGAASSIISLSRIVKADHRASATRGGWRACDRFVQLEFGRKRHSARMKAMRAYGVTRMIVPPELTSTSPSSGSRVLDQDPLAMSGSDGSLDVR